MRVVHGPATPNGAVTDVFRAATHEISVAGHEPCSHDDAGLASPDRTKATTATRANVPSRSASTRSTRGERSFTTAHTVSGPRRFRGSDLDAHLGRPVP